MPTYEYACRDCGEHLEVVQSFKDDQLTVCPNCDGALRKVFSAAGIIFKGSGWHIKDYASKPKETTKSESSGSGSKSGSSETSSSTPKGGSSTSKDGSSMPSDRSSSSTPEAKSA